MHSSVATLERDALERRDVADIAPVREECSEYPLDHRIDIDARGVRGVRCRVDERMRGMRVRHRANALEREFEVRFAPRLPHLRAARVNRVAPAETGAVERVVGQPAARHVRQQSIRMPDDFRADVGTQRAQRIDGRVQMALADPAPRTHEVEPAFDRQLARPCVAELIAAVAAIA
ncbi:Uncharacterised protein [Burkholderia pseudomallei]|nr:Uncharacterised protein [Burkholderia pseudomallei]